MTCRLVSSVAIILLCIIAMAALPACSLIGNDNSVIDSKYGTASVDGKQLTLKLGAEKTDGTQWAYRFDSKSLVCVIDHFEIADPMPDSTESDSSESKSSKSSSQEGERLEVATQTYVFEGKSAGSVTIDFCYTQNRYWTYGSKAEPDFSIVVEVGSDGVIESVKKA